MVASCYQPVTLYWSMTCVRDIKSKKQTENLKKETMDLLLKIIQKFARESVRKTSPVRAHSNDVGLHVFYTRVYNKLLN